MAVWAPRGQPPIVRVAPGREKTHFYGTLGLLTGREIVTRADTLNSEATAHHLEQVLAAYPGRRILLFWDRATWHRGPAVQEVLEANPHLEVWVLPPASPDLNPQEQVWKAARRATSHNHTVSQLPDLADRFEDYLRSTSFESSFLDRYGYKPFRSLFK